MTFETGMFEGTQLQGMNIAIMAASGFTQAEFTELQRAMAQAGATIKIISCDNGLINGWDGAGFGHTYPIDAQLGDVLAADLDALIVPGGARNITKLKTNLNTARIVRNMIDGMRPVVLMGEAADLLTHAGREATSDVMTLTVTAETPAGWAAQAVEHIASILTADQQDMQAAA